MLETATTYAPQILAALFALGGALGLNAFVALAKRIPTKSARWKSLYGMLPHVVGALCGYWVWQEILSLGSTGIPLLEDVVWADYPFILVSMGLGQGASAQSLYEFYKTSVVGPGGVLDRLIQRAGGVNDPELSAIEAAFMPREEE